MKKRHKKIIIIAVGILFISIALFLISSKVYAAGPEQGMFPDISTLFDSNNKSKYLNQYRDNYYLDIKESGVFKSFDFNIFNGLANVLFKLTIVLTYVAIIIVYYAFELSLTEIMKPVLNELVKALQVSIFNEFATVCICLLGVFYVVKIIREQKTQIWTAILQTIAVVVITLFFFHDPAKVLTNIDNFSKATSQSVLEGTFQATNKGSTVNSATMAICDNLWVMCVHRPWEILEFGDIKLAQQHEEKVLAQKPGSTERQDYINKLAKDNEDLFPPFWGLERFSMLILYIIPLIFIIGVIGLLCLLVIAYQSLMMFQAMAGPFVFLAALVPWWGFRALTPWASKLFGYGSMKIVLAFLVTVIFAFNTAIFKLSEKYGWFFTMLTQAIVIWSIYWKKDKLFDFIIVARNSLQGNHHVVKREFRKDANVEGYLRNLRSSRNNVGGNPGYGQGGNSNSGSSNGSGSSGMNMNPNLNYSPGSSNSGGNNSAGYYNQNPTTNSSNNNKDNRYDDDNNHDKNYDNDRLWKDATSANNRNYKDLLKISEEILEQQYENSKKESEEKAKAAGTEPTYDYWVQKVMNREKMNLPKFEEREKVAVARDLERIQSMGGNPEDLITKRNEGKGGNEKIVLDLNSTDEILDFGNQDNIEASLPDLSKEYTKDFNTTFNKNYDPKFMERLIGKYGQENVRVTLDRMKEINEREEIKNPAGYLTESVKNNYNNNDIQEKQKLPTLNLTEQMGENAETIFSKEELEAFDSDKDIQRLGSSKENLTRDSDIRKGTTYDKVEKNTAVYLNENVPSSDIQDQEKTKASVLNMETEYELNSNPEGTDVNNVAPKEIKSSAEGLGVFDLEASNSDSNSIKEDIRRHSNSNGSENGNINKVSVQSTNKVNTAGKEQYQDKKLLEKENRSTVKPIKLDLGKKE